MRKSPLCKRVAWLLRGQSSESHSRGVVALEKGSCHNQSGDSPNSSSQPPASGSLAEMSSAAVLAWKLWLGTVSAGCETATPRSTGPELEVSLEQTYIFRGEEPRKDCCYEQAKLRWVIFVFAFYFDTGNCHVVLTGLTECSFLAWSSPECACLCLTRAGLKARAPCLMLSRAYRYLLSHFLILDLD